MLPVDKLLTFKEAMAFLRVSRSTLLRLMWKRQLAGHKVGNTWRFYVADLRLLVDEPTQEQQFFVGDRVRHFMFGSGTVWDSWRYNRYTGRPLAAEVIEVVFDEIYGRKQLDTRFARLEKIPSECEKGANE